MNSKKRRERKQLITVIVVFAVLLALLAVYFVIRNTTAGEGSETGDNGADVGQSGTFQIIDEDYLEVTAIKYKYEGEELDLRLKDRRWVLEDDPKFPVEQATVIEMAQAISDYGGFAEIVYDESRRSAYGIDDPKLDVSVTYSEDGKDRTRRFIMGAQNKTTGYYYFYEEGSSEIYAVNDSIMPYFSFLKADLLAETVPPTPQSKDILALTVEYDGGKFEFDAEKDGAVSGDEEDDPVNLIMSSMPKTANLQYPDLAAYGVDEDGLSEYGLDEPSLRIVLKYKEYSTVPTGEDGSSSAQISKDVEYVFLFGSLVTEGEGDDARELVYVAEEGSGTVYKVSADKFNGIYSAASGAPAAPDSGEETG